MSMNFRLNKFFFFWHNGGPDRGGGLGEASQLGRALFELEPGRASFFRLKKTFQGSYAGRGKKYTGRRSEGRLE